MTDDLLSKERVEKFVREMEKKLPLPTEPLTEMENYLHATLLILSELNKIRSE